jgi:hypothetical protein
MENFDAPWDDSYEIDPEIWLQALLAMTSNKDDKERLVKGIAGKTGLVPEKVELLIDCTIEFMANKARSN